MTKSQSHHAGRNESSDRIRALEKRSSDLERRGEILRGARVYLSGPMDFVASRAEEKRSGWRTRVGQFLRALGVTVFDPWEKPEVVGMPHYGKEDEFSNEERHQWTFEDNEEGARVRARLGDHFWSTLHIDLRMVDTSDFLVAYVPTNIYSVGTVHEIVFARQQHKPVLFVSPAVTYPSVAELRGHLESAGDTSGVDLLDLIAREVPVLENPHGTPSMWYMGLIDPDYWFDGFGFDAYRDRFDWSHSVLDDRERDCRPVRALLPYIEKLNCRLPKHYDLDRDSFVVNPDWLIFDQRPIDTDSSRPDLQRERDDDH
jgi:hypothetical protein